jgi:hypothetical protein
VVDELVTGVAELRLDWATLELLEDAILAIDVAALELDWATLELVAEEVLAWLVEIWGVLTEDTGMTTGGSKLEELWEVDNPGVVVEAVKALDTEIPTLVNGAWLVEEARDMMLDDAEIGSPRLILGTFDDDADALRLLMLGTFDDDAIRLLLLPDVTGITTTELLLNDVGKLTADDVVLELGRILDGVTSSWEEIAGCEEITVTLTVGEDMISAVMLLEALTVLEATAGWEGALEVMDSAAEGFCELADDKDVWLVPLTGMTPTLILPTPMLTT